MELEFEPRSLWAAEGLWWLQQQHMMGGGVILYDYGLQARMVYSEPDHLQEMEQSSQTTLTVPGTFAKRCGREEKYRVDFRKGDVALEAHPVDIQWKLALYRLPAVL